MKTRIPGCSKYLFIAVLGATLACSAQATVNTEGAMALAKRSDCLKCHAIDKDKKASSFQKIAAKWKGKADAQSRLTDTLTKSPKVKMTDGSEEEHKAVKTQDASEIKNLIDWILSQ